jgi:hypothetical protein
MPREWAAAKLQHMQNAANHFPVATRFHTGRFIGIKGSITTPLLVDQPVIVRTQPAPVNRELEPQWIGFVQRKIEFRS